MKRMQFGLSSLIVVGIIACDVFSAPASTNNSIATGVAGTLTAQAQQAAAVASTVAALGGTRPVSPAPPAISPVPLTTPIAATTGSIMGLVISSSTSQPIANAYVALVDIPTITANTGNDGRYTLLNVPAGAHIVQASTNLGTSNPVSVVVPAGGSATADLAIFTALPTPPPPPPSAYYNLVLRYSKKCLGVQSGVATEMTCDASTQIWNLPPTTTGDSIQLQVQNSGTCLSASSNHETDPLVLRSCGGGDAQLWQARLSGGYFQLANRTQLAEDPTNMCADARQWDQPLMQWPCKPWGNDDQLDNQLFCQSTTAVDTCTPPPGVYVTSIQQDPPPYSDSDKPNTFHVNFRVTFNNTTGSALPYSWFVRTTGTNGGQTPQQRLAIPPGISTIAVGPWNINHTCTNFTAKAQWIRPSDGLLFTFKDLSGIEYSLPFQVCK